MIEYDEYAFITGKHDSLPHEGTEYYISKTEFQFYDRSVI